ncbi:qcr6-ubiquinol--cytochrome-c reductase 17k protein [Malassezia pachydermatis]|uniref:Qcr6-ubiquinol--cytochrome-c reductase 17k protein n=1 Tax=Malassezia pachydermatis TaxID=77020 RepID=A0A0N0RRW9_9BASI|nr:qcr6-ubiquinol--cytochrome-c reductase 17k protein [Malassezia pachydermatis]KOS12795.1 qcr6-ubiquinol--cytochrome-c reductase 17k protein [Malassezia pachydermatis]
MSLLATLANFGSSSSAVEATPSTGAWYEAFFPVAHNEEEDSEDEEEEEEEEEEEDDEEDDEPEDVYPEIYEKCQNSPACESARHHFEECQERVTGGKGFEGEDCVEELKLFAQLA